MFLPIQKKHIKETDFVGMSDIYNGGDNFSRNYDPFSMFFNCKPSVSVPVATGIEINARKDGEIITRDGNKKPVTEQVITSKATLPKVLRNKFLPTRKKILIAPPKSKRRDPTAEEVSQGQLVNTMKQFAVILANTLEEYKTATPDQKIPLIINLIQLGMKAQQASGDEGGEGGEIEEILDPVADLIENDPDIPEVEELPPDAPADKTLVSWIKKAPRAMADLLKKGKVNILDPLARAMVKVVGKIKIEDGNVVVGGFKISLSRLADIGYDGIVQLTGANMPEGARDLGNLLLEQINVEPDVEEKKQEELELLEESKHDKDDIKVGFIQPVVPEISRVVELKQRGPTRQAPGDPGIGIFAPNDPRKAQFEREMKAEEEDIADLKAELNSSLKTLEQNVILFRQAQAMYKGKKMEKGRESYLKKVYKAEKNDLYKVMRKVDDKTIMSTNKIKEYRKEIGKADTPDKLKLIADILNQELEVMYPKIKPSEKRSDYIREREAGIVESYLI